MRIGRQFLDLFLETKCPLCERSAAAGLCQTCWRRIEQCRMPLASSLDGDDLPVFCWGRYGDGLKRAIASLKYENQPEIGRYLGRCLGQHWLKAQQVRSQQVKPESNPSARAIFVPAIVVPIPLHAHKQKKRGYNQAALIGEGFCEVTHLRLKRQGLERVLDTTAQFGLSAGEREQNLADAFQVNPRGMGRSPHRPILLIDDIYTTGATARAAARAFKVAGYQVSGLAAIARPLYEGLRGDRDRA